MLVWVERKVVARFQDRLGPNRIGPFGLIQPFADIIKLVIKEDITPAGADKLLYNIGPVLAIASVIILVGHLAALVQNIWRGLECCCSLSCGCRGPGYIIHYRRRLGFQ